MGCIHITWHSFLMRTDVRSLFHFPREDSHMKRSGFSSENLNQTPKGDQSGHGWSFI